MDTEQFSKIQIFLAGVFQLPTNWISLKFFFFLILLIDFRIATNLKTRSSKKCYLKSMFVDSKTSTTKIIYLKVH